MSTPPDALVGPKLRLLRLLAVRLLQGVLLGLVLFVVSLLVQIYL